MEPGNQTLWFRHRIRLITLKAAVSSPATPATTATWAGQRGLVILCNCTVAVALALAGQMRRVGPVEQERSAGVLPGVPEALEAVRQPATAATVPDLAIWQVNPAATTALAAAADSLAGRELGRSSS